MTPRRRLIAGLVAGLLVLVGLRLLGGGDDGEGAAPPITTTTLEETTTTEEPVEEPPTTVEAPPPPPTDTTISGPPVAIIQTLEVGDCFSRGAEEEVTEVRLVACEEPHTDEVYTVLVLKNPPGARYPANLDDQAEDGCYRAFVTFTGRAPEETPYGYDWYVPTADQWRQGARRIPCVVTDPEGKPITGSAADATA